MFKSLLLSSILLVSANAGFSEKVAASFSAKYEVCSLKLGNKLGYKIKALTLKIKANEIHKEQIGNGYLKALEKEKKKAWKLPLSKCKSIADNL